ncbi:MAG: type III-B CRISPR module RAMP protein Cmr6, partial [Synechococcaceae cyanobacterium RL_1_2]|nr:type III-B CRISPR module RAMP protein Cmr6 [Synechococcaceae cyanobacterium RL_1_2]
GKLFGAISPTQNHGYLRVNIREGKVTQKEAKPTRQGKNDPCGEMEGLLSISFSPEVSSNISKPIESLTKNLTWLMFNLGWLWSGCKATLLFPKK